MSISQNPPTTPKHHTSFSTIPEEVIYSVLSHIHSPRTLSNLLTVSKLFCRVIIPILYRNVSIDLQSDLLIDTGLSADLLMVEVTKGSEEEEDIVVGNRDWDNTERSTFKRVYLGHIDTINLYRSKRSTSTHPNTPSPAEDHTNPQSTQLKATSTPLTFATLNLWVDNDHCRSPLHTQDREILPRAIVNFLETLRPTRLILDGVRLHQKTSPTANLPASIFSTYLREVIIILRPGISLWDDNYHKSEPRPNLPGCHVLDVISHIHEMAQKVLNGLNGLETPPVNITYILETSNDTQRPPLLPMSLSCPSLVDYETYHSTVTLPLFRMVESLIRQIVSVRPPRSTDHPSRRIGTIVFVNFGAWWIGKKEQSKHQLQNFIGAQIRSGLTLYGLEVEDQMIEFLDMREWLGRQGSGGKGIMKEDILRGWAEVKDKQVNKGQGVDTMM